MKLQSIIPIIFLIISPFAANAYFTTYSGYDSFGNSFNATETKIGDSTFTSGSTSNGDSFNATEYNFDSDNDYDYDLDFDF